MSILLMLFLFGQVSGETCSDATVQCPRATHVEIFPRPVFECESACTIEDCCLERTCNNWLSDNDFCRNVPDAVPRDGTTCPGGQCDFSICCFVPSSCKEFQDQNRNLCYTGDVYAVQRPSFNETCPNSCDQSRCCRPATTCGEYDSSTRLCFGNYFKFPIQDKPCSGYEQCTQESCCRGPQTCDEHSLVDSRMGNSLCGIGFEYKKGDLTSQCPNGVCTKDRCCQPTTTCGDADNSVVTRNISALCHKRNLVLSPSSQCTYASGNCTESVCCTQPTHCFEYARINSSCANTSLYFDQYASSGNPFNASTCCRPPESCHEVEMVTPNLCSSTGLVFSSNSCQDGVCDKATCCRQPQFCEEVQDLVTCSGPFETFASSKNCMGNCNAATCCEPITACNYLQEWYGVCDTIEQYPNNGVEAQTCHPNCDFNTCCRPRACRDFFNEANIDPLFCLTKNQFPLVDRTCAQCSVDTCCGAPASCEEANLFQGNKLCAGVGLINKTKACSGATCSQAECCIKPRSCHDVRDATSSNNFPSNFCAHDGFVDNFGPDNACDGSCTPATCCNPISTCQEWVYSQSISSIVTGQSMLPCKRGGYFDETLQCQDGICDETSCCRAPTTCGEAQLFCGENGVVQNEKPCVGSGCNIATCCRNATMCAQLEDLCLSAGKINTASTTPCPDGKCTAATCCRAHESCKELSIVATCPVGSVMNTQRTCGPICDTSYCCDRVPMCVEILNEMPLFCQGRFTNATASVLPCPNGDCTEDFCCRTAPLTCGEASVKSPTLCGGSVDFFKPCVGAQCTDTKFCCRPPVNCREVIGSRNVTCGPGWTPTALNEPSCPGGVCDATTCCKEIATCRDASAAVQGGLCVAPTILNPTEACGGAQACDTATCCRAPSTCGEATSLCSGALPLANEQAVDTPCAPGNCTSAKCCRAAEYCGEAYFLDTSLCSKQGRDFNRLASTQRCTACATECCIAKTTFAPTTAAPTAPTTSQPTPRPSNNCPSDALRALLGACRESDFRAPHTSCTANCKAAGVSLLTAFAPANVSSVTVCLEEVLGSGYNLSAVDRTYVVKQVEAKAALCATTTVNASPVVTYSAFVMGLLLIAVY